MGFMPWMVWLLAARAAGSPFDPAWERTWNAPANGRDVAWGAAAGPGGLIYVSGYVQRTDRREGFNGWLGAFGPDGAPLWVREYDSPERRDDEWHGVAVNRGGRIFVTGAEYRDDLRHGNDLVVAEYAPDGRLLWTFTHDGAGSEDYGIDVAADAEGRLVVVGYEDRPDLKQGWNIWTRKFGPDRATLWTRTYDSPAHGHDEGQAVALDDLGNVYVSGWTRRDDLTQGYNAWARAYGPHGDVRWTWEEDAGAGADELALAIAPAPDGGVWVCGWEDRPDLGEHYNAWVARLDERGRKKWKRTYDAPAHAYEYLHRIAVDRDGTAWCAGYEDRPDLGEGLNALLLRYAPDGMRLDRVAWDGGGRAEDIAWALALDGRGGLAVAGSTERPDLGQAENIFVRLLRLPPR